MITMTMILMKMDQLFKMIYHQFYLVPKQAIIQFSPWRGHEFFFFFLGGGGGGGGAENIFWPPRRVEVFYLVRGALFQAML